MTAEVKDEPRPARGQLGQRPPSRGGRSGCGPAGGSASTCRGRAAVEAEVGLRIIARTAA